MTWWPFQEQYYVKRLEEIVLADDQILTVRTSNKDYRAIVHYWAAKEGLLHVPIISKSFPDVKSYGCQRCGRLVYPRREYCDCDCNSENIRYLRCTTPDCDGYNDRFTGESHDLERHRYEFNAVLVARGELPPIPEGRGRKRQRKYWMPKEPPIPDYPRWGTKMLVQSRDKFNIDLQRP